MKKIILLAIIIGGFSACNQKKQKESYSITVINPFGIERPDEPVTIMREDLQGYENNKNKYPVIANSDHEILPFQLDDIDGDGQWDELFLLIDLKPKDTVVLDMEYRGTSSNIKFKKRANIRLGSAKAPYEELDSPERLLEGDTKITSQHFQMEGPSWENDVIGFRNYYDARNGIDIFGKQTKEMALDSAGINGQDYHAMADWGMDVLKVGNSLGAGSIALMENDSIYRWSPSGKGSYRLIADGPLRAILEFNFDGWELSNSKVEVKHRISIWGGSNLYKSEISIDKSNENVSLLTGIVNLKSDSLYVGDFENEIILATHDTQAENEAHLGMALIMQQDDYIQHFETTDQDTIISDTYIANLKLSKADPVTFYFYAQWENENQSVKNVRWLLSTLKMKTDILMNPAIIK